MLKPSSGKREGFEPVHMGAEFPELALLSAFPLEN